jgi:hypothetical protein
MTQPERDMLKAAWHEASGKVDEWLALNELPDVVLRLCGDGYLQIRPAGPGTWERRVDAGWRGGRAPPVQVGALASACAAFVAVGLRHKEGP